MPATTPWSLFQSFGRVSRSLQILTAGAAIGMAAAGALAQGPGGGGRGFGGGPGGDVLQPSVNSREIDRLTKIVALDKDQQEAVKTLFESYQEQFKARSQDLRTKMERTRDEFRDSRDPTVWQNLRGDMDKFRPVRDEMEQSFLSDVKTVLRDDQQASWPKFERAVRRSRGLNRGRLSGERVDLIAIVERVDLPDDSKKQVEPVLELYEADLDRTLAARMEFEKEQMSKFFETMQSGDTQAMQKMLEEGRKLSVAVRDVNRRYARQVEDLVPEDKKTMITEEVKRQSFGRIYGETRAERLVKAAEAMKDLSAEQKTAIDAMASSFNREMTSLNDQLAKAQEKLEMTVTAENMMTMFRGGDGGPLDDLYTKRRQLGSKTEDELRKLLTPEQQERLPKADDNGGGRRGPGGGQADEGGRPQRAAPRRQGTGGNNGST